MWMFDNGWMMTRQYYLPGKWILQALEMCLYSMTRLFYSTNIVTPLPLSWFSFKTHFSQNPPASLSGIQLTTLVMTRMFPVMKSIRAPVLKYHLRKIRKKNKL